MWKNPYIPADLMENLLERSKQNENNATIYANRLSNLARNISPKNPDIQENLRVYTWLMERIATLNADEIEQLRKLDDLLRKERVIPDSIYYVPPVLQSSGKVIDITKQRFDVLGVP